jgi:hypothetical protein
MKINLIIGAGQLGSRHLQGLLRLEQAQQIYVLDPFEQSLEIAKDRAKEIPNKHTIKYITDWNSLPEEFDLVIIATGANVRAKITTELLEKYKVKHLVLEKILFQDLESYNKIEFLLKKTNTATWINHPRRMIAHYQQIKEIIADSKEKVNFQAVGSDWGLACSALHFIDIFAFLSGSNVETLDMDWIDDVIHQSKRAGYIELTGTVKGTLGNGNNFFVSSLQGEIGDVTIYVSTNSNRWIIQEGRAQKIIHLSKENGFNEKIINFETEFQSTITTRIANDIFEGGNCNLPTYAEACSSHIPFINATLKKIATITTVETTICPIT